MEHPRMDHIALLVKDLDKAVEDYKEILRVLDPENSTEIVWESAKEGGYQYQSATFVSQNGQPVIQLLTSENPKDQKRLKEKGECVHHLEFCVDNVANTAKKLEEIGVSLVSGEPTRSESMPWQESILISPKKTHGVLVKIASDYEVINGEWVPK